MEGSAWSPSESPFCIRGVRVVDWQQDLDWESLPNRGMMLEGLGRVAVEGMLQGSAL